MADWQEAAQASVIAFIFAFMVAKLVSVVIYFRRSELRIERGRGRALDEEEEEELLLSDFELQRLAAEDAGSGNGNENQELGGVDLDASKKSTGTGKEGTALPSAVLSAEQEEDGKNVSDDDDIRPSSPFFECGLEAVSSAHVEGEDDRSSMDSAASSASALEENRKGGDDAAAADDDAEIKASFEELGDLSDSDEWEGVESSELDESFGAAAAFVATQATGQGLKLSNETQLLLYGLYKIATEGPCFTSQPPAYKISARAKWNAWQKLGNISPEEAMHRYIAVVSENTSWDQENDTSTRRTGDSTKGSASERGGMGPVFSSLVMSEEGVAEEGTLEAIHICAREGDQAGLQQQLENGTPVDLADSDGRTALHWAADRGHLQVVELLLAKGAQIHAKDSEGQTALHYAATCEREEIAKRLVRQGAEPSLKDNDGVSPLASRPVNWIWMGGTF